jgi:hypothetical protein
VYSAEALDAAADTTRATSATGKKREKIKCAKIKESFYNATYFDSFEILVNL